MSVTTTESVAEDRSESAPLRLRAVLVVLAAVCIWAFFYANNRTEEFRLMFPRFHPWLWNLYLTCVPIALVGALGLWWCRRWGFWTIVGAALLATIIGLYAMGFTLIGTAIVLALTAVWFAAQPVWKSFR